MDIALLGVRIDPAGAVEGGQKAAQAARTMAAEIGKAAADVEKASERASDAAQEAGEETAAAVTKAAKSTTEAARTTTDAAKNIGSGVATMGNQASASAAMVARAQDYLAARAAAAAAATARASTQTAQAVVNMGQQATAGATQAAQAVVNVASPTTWQRIRTQAQQTAGAVGGAFAQMRAQAVAFATTGGNAITGAFARMRTAAAGLGGANRYVVDLANAAGMLNGPLGNAVSRLTSFSGIVGRIPAGIGPLIAILGGLAAALLAVGVAVSTTFAAMSAAGPVQAAQLGLETVTGSAEQAEAVLTALRENAKKTGADITASLDTGLKFIGLGFSPADAVKLNQSIQDIAGTLGMSSARAAELGNALAQVQSKGVVSMEELRQQIAEKGVPVFDELAKKLNVTQGELIKLVSEGKVRSKELIDIFLNLEGGFAKFAGGAERGTAKMPGAIARIKANWQDLLVTMGTPINDAVAPILNAISDAMGGLGTTAQQVGQMIADGINAAAPAITAFVDGAAEKMRGFFAMVNSEAGLGEAWARNIWATFVSYGLTAVQNITAGFAVIGQLLARFAVDFIETLAIVTTPEFWDMVGSTLGSIAISFENGLRAAAETFVNAILGALPDWMGGKGPKLDLGRVVNPTIPGPNITKPNLFNDNDAPLDIGAMFKANAEGMATVLDGTRQEWARWQSDWNNLNLQPIKDKINPKTPLSTKGGSSENNDPVEAMKKGASEAEKVAKQMEAAAKKYIEASRTPLEKYAATVNEINKLQAAGFLTVDQAAKASVLALEQLNEGTRRAAEKAATPLQKLMMQWGNLKTQIQDVNASIAQTFADGMGNAVSSLISGTATASEAFAQMASSIVNDITKMITKLLIQWAIQQALGMLGGGGAQPINFNAASAAAATAGVMHTGGSVGSATSTRTVSAAAFANAPRFAHGGTVPGVGGGETPIIAEPGEQVLTRNQSSDIKKRLGDASKGAEKKDGKQAVTILNVIDPSMIRDTIAKNPDIIINAISSQASKVKRVLSVA